VKTKKHNVPSVLAGPIEILLQRKGVAGALRDKKKILFTI
jgi:hypothetical protein